MQGQTTQFGCWNPAGAIAGWLVPGLGHYLCGERRRGVILCVTIHALWLIGLFVGGLGVIDRHGQTMWFLAQMLMAPSLVVDYLVTLDHQTHAIVQGYGRMTDQGVLFTSLAGMLNLMAVVDVLYRDEIRPREAEAEASAEAGEGAELAEAGSESGGER